MKVLALDRLSAQLCALTASQRKQRTVTLKYDIGLVPERWPTENFVSLSVTALVDTRFKDSAFLASKIYDYATQSCQHKKLPCI